MTRSIALALFGALALSAPAFAQDTKEKAAPYRNDAQWRRFKARQRQARRQARQRQARLQAQRARRSLPRGVARSLGEALKRGALPKTQKLQPLRLERAPERPLPRYTRKPAPPLTLQPKVQPLRLQHLERVRPPRPQTPRDPRLRLHEPQPRPAIGQAKRPPQSSARPRPKASKPLTKTARRMGAGIAEALRRARR